MDKTTFESKLIEMLNERMAMAEKVMSKMTNLKNAYAKFRMQGQEKGAEAFRNQVFMMLCENPMMDERQIIMELTKELNIKL